MAQPAPPARPADGDGSTTVLELEDDGRAVAAVQDITNGREKSAFTSSGAAVMRAKDEPRGRDRGDRPHGQDDCESEAECFHSITPEIARTR